MSLRGNKYHAVRTGSFASKKEARRYAELELLERAGAILGLEPHPRYPLMVNGVLCGHYTPDARYREDGRIVVEEVKSPATRKLADYRLRVKVFRACYPDIEHREI